MKKRKLSLKQSYRKLLSKQKSLEAQLSVTRHRIYEFEQKFMGEIIK